MIVAPDLDVILIRITGAEPRALLHQHLMAAPHERGGRGRHQADAMLLLFNFFRDADDHLEGDGDE